MANEENNSYIAGSQPAKPIDELNLANRTNLIRYAIRTELIGSKHTE